jgi:molybdenum cofactor cytidylyltransferase
VALVAIVLAAGRGSRFGGDKLAAKLNGRSLLDHAVAAACAAPVERVLVVTRPGATISDHPRVERVETWSEALSDTLRAGLAVASTHAAEGAFIFLGDMPLVPPSLAAALAEAIGPSLAAMPVRDGAPGHPVLISRAAFSLVDDLSGDEGLGRVLRNRNDVVSLETSDPGALFDVDTLADLVAAQRDEAR